MAGRGPQPKDPRDRARRNKGPDLTLITTEPEQQPELPDKMPGGDDWPDQTRSWWQMWAESPLTVEYTAQDWADLLDCAVLHGKFWNGAISVANELRLRVAKHGMTREDRARLRIQFASADSAEVRRDREKDRQGTGASRGQYGGLKAV